MHPPLSIAQSTISPESLFDMVEQQGALAIYNGMDTGSQV
jgi:hypothetical protein